MLTITRIQCGIVDALKRFIAPRQRILLVGLVACGALLFANHPAAASTSPIFETRSVAADIAPINLFGGSVAISDDTMVVGAKGDDDAGNNSGSVYVFTRSGTTWTQQAKLNATDAAAGDLFGNSVAIDADTIVVGARGDNHGDLYSGSAYVFVRSGTTWTQQAKLNNSQPYQGDRFGDSVAIDADTIVVGASAGEVLIANPGSAYVFTRNANTWTHQAKLDGRHSTHFGISVAIDADTIVVGVSADDSDYIPGTTYVFTRNGTTWTRQAVLKPSDVPDNSTFGRSVDIDADSIVVGAGGGGFRNFPAAAYVFIRTGTTWTEQAKIDPPESPAKTRFGWSVAIDADRIVVSAPREYSLVATPEFAHVFTRTGTTWSLQSKLKASDGANFDKFGESVAVDNDQVVVGARRGYPSDDNGFVCVFVNALANVAGGGVSSGDKLTADEEPMPTDIPGYSMLESDGEIYNFGDEAPCRATTTGTGMDAIDFDSTADGQAKWILSSDGVVHTRGNATHYGNVPLSSLAAGDQVSSISATPSGNGYWVFSDLGQVLTFGDAQHFGDLPGLGITPSGLIVASSPTPTGLGYYQLGADGGVFAFGDAAFHGSIPGVLAPGALSCPIVGLVSAPTNDGYWMVACDGGVFAFGDAPFRGSLPGVIPAGTQLNAPINGLVPYGNGYLMVAGDGGVFTFSDEQFLGSLGANPPNSPIVAITAYAS